MSRPWRLPSSGTRSISGSTANSRIRCAHVARSIELMGAQGAVSEELVSWISAGGRCYSARAGRLDDALGYADRVQEASDAIDSPRFGRGSR